MVRYKGRSGVVTKASGNSPRACEPGPPGSCFVAFRNRPCSVRSFVNKGDFRACTWRAGRRGSSACRQCLVEVGEGMAEARLSLRGRWAAGGRAPRRFNTSLTRASTPGLAAIADRLRKIGGDSHKARVPRKRP